MNRHERLRAKAILSPKEYLKLIEGALARSETANEALRKRNLFLEGLLQKAEEHEKVIVVLDDGTPKPDEYYYPAEQAEQMTTTLEKALNAQIDLGDALLRLHETVSNVTAITLVYPMNSKPQNGLQTTTLAEQVKGLGSVLAFQMTAIIDAAKQLGYAEDVELRAITSMIAKLMGAIQECHQDQGATLQKFVADNINDVIKNAAAYRESVTRHRDKAKRTTRLIELIDQHKPEGKPQWDIIAHNVYGALKRMEIRLDDLDKSVLQIELEGHMTKDLVMTQKLINYLQNTYNQAKRREAKRLQEAKKLQSGIEVLQLQKG